MIWCCFVRDSHRRASLVRIFGDFFIVSIERLTNKQSSWRGLEKPKPSYYIIQWYCSGNHTYNFGDMQYVVANELIKSLQINPDNTLFRPRKLLPKNRLTSQSPQHASPISHIAPFVTEMCTCVHISVTKRCIMGYTHCVNCEMGLLYICFVHCCILLWLNPGRF